MPSRFACRPFGYLTNCLMDGAAYPYYHTVCSILAQFSLVIAMLVVPVSYIDTDSSFESPGGRPYFGPKRSTQSAGDGLVAKFEDTGLRNIQIVSITIAALLLADWALNIWDSVKERNTMMERIVGSAVEDDRQEDPAAASSTKFWASPQVKEAWMRFQFVISMLVPCIIQYATPPTPRKVFILHACLAYNHVTIFAVAQFAITVYFDRTFTQRMRTFAITVLFTVAQLVYGFCAYFDMLLLPAGALTLITAAMYIAQVSSCYWILYSRMKRDRHRYEWQNWATFVIYTLLVMVGLIVNIAISGRRKGVYLNYTLTELYVIHSVMIIFALFIALLPVSIARQQVLRVKSKINSTRRLVDHRVANPLRAMQHALQEIFTTSHTSQTLLCTGLVSNMTPTQFQTFAEIVTACDAALRSLEDVNDALTLTLMRDDVATDTSRDSGSFSIPTYPLQPPQAPQLPQPQEQPLPQRPLRPPRHPSDAELAAARNFPAKSVPLRSALKKRRTQLPTSMVAQRPPSTSVPVTAATAAATTLGCDQRQDEITAAQGLRLYQAVLGLRRSTVVMGARRRAYGPPTGSPDTDADLDVKTGTGTRKATATIKSDVSHGIAESSLPISCRSSPLSMSRGSDPIAWQLMRTPSENDRDPPRTDYKAFYARNQPSECSCSSLSSCTEAQGIMGTGTGMGTGWKPEFVGVDE